MQRLPIVEQRPRRVRHARSMRSAIALCAVLVLGTGAAPSSAATSVKVFFGQGEQLAAVQRPGATVEDALQALVAGPTRRRAGEDVPHLRARGHAVRSATVAGDVATVDLGDGFMQGIATDTTLARLDQLVSTVTSVPGITSVQRPDQAAARRSASSPASMRPCR